MIYTDKTKNAMKLCFKAHKDQVDKSGMPYVFHPFHVAEQMTDETTTIVALLHDVVEDTDFTLEDIAAMGFGQDVVAALSLMTHDKSVPYLDYVAKIRDNPVAWKVKLADLAHNSDQSRLDVIDEKVKERLEKYRRAIAILDPSVQNISMDLSYNNHSVSELTPEERWDKYYEMGREDKD